MQRVARRGDLDVWNRKYAEVMEALDRDASEAEIDQLMSELEQAMKPFRQVSTGTPSGPTRMGSSRVSKVPDTDRPPAISSSTEPVRSEAISSSRFSTSSSRARA